MTTPWQLFLTWGLMVGIGAGAGAVGMAAAVANRWFAKRNGLAMGLLTAANAAGQLVFLPLLALLAERYGWRGVPSAVTLAIAAVVPVVALLMPEWPADIGLRPLWQQPRSAPARPCGRRQPVRGRLRSTVAAPRIRWISGCWPELRASAACRPTG